VQFFRDILDDLSSVAAVDLSRVYVSGFSNGGGMAVRIACEASDQVAAIGSVAGAVVGLGGCNPLRPVPVIAFHGTADPIVRYQGGMLRGWFLRDAAGVTRAPNFFVGAEDWVATWAEGNGCDSRPAVGSPQGDVRVTRYTGCDQNATVILYTIEGGGHTWPGGWPIPAVGRTSREIDATEAQWRFFQRYTLAGRASEDARDTEYESRWPGAYKTCVFFRGL
jgi:polyhydroxybutyrate depolymerase